MRAGEYWRKLSGLYAGAVSSIPSNVAIPKMQGKIVLRKHHNGDMRVQNRTITQSKTKL